MADDKRIFDGEEYRFHSSRREQAAQKLKKSLRADGLKVRTVKSKKYATRKVFYRKK